MHTAIYLFNNLDNRKGPSSKNAVQKGCSFGALIFLLLLLGSFAITSRFMNKQGVTLTGHNTTGPLCAAPW